VEGKDAVRGRKGRRGKEEQGKYPAPKRRRQTSPMRRGKDGKKLVDPHADKPAATPVST
jgi:hypothetical protein